MEFEEEEQALVDAHLELDTSDIGWWIYIAVGGGVFCLAAVVAFLTEQVGRPEALLFFIVGLVVIDLGMEFRRKRIMARILQKYQEAVEGQSEAGNKIHPDND